MLRFRYRWLLFYFFSFALPTASQQRGRCTTSTRATSKYTRRVHVIWSNGLGERKDLKAGSPFDVRALLGKPEADIRERAVELFLGRQAGVGDGRAVSGRLQEEDDDKLEGTSDQTDHTKKSNTSTILCSLLGTAEPETTIPAYLLPYFATVVEKFAGHEVFVWDDAGINELVRFAERADFWTDVMPPPVPEPGGVAEADSSFHGHGGHDEDVVRFRRYYLEEGLNITRRFPRLHPSKLVPRWFRSDKISETVKYRDVAKFLVLYRYGGLFLDLDIEILKDPTPLLEYLVGADGGAEGVEVEGGPAILLDPSTAVIYTQPRHPFWVELLWHLEATINREMVRPEPVLAVERVRYRDRGKDGDVKRELETDGSLMFELHERAVEKLFREKRVEDVEESERSSKEEIKDKFSSFAISLSTPEKIHYRSRYYQFVVRTFRHAYDRSIFGVNGLNRIFFLPTNFFNPFEIEWQLLRTAILDVKQAATRQWNQLRRGGYLGSLMNYCARKYGLTPAMWAVAGDLDAKRKEEEVSSAIVLSAERKGIKIISERQGDGEGAPTPTLQPPASDVVVKGKGANRGVQKVGTPAEKDATPVVEFKPKSKLDLLWEQVDFGAFLFSYHDCYGGFCTYTWSKEHRECLAVSALNRHVWIQKDQPHGFLKYYYAMGIGLGMGMAASDPRQGGRPPDTNSRKVMNRTTTITAGVTAGENHEQRPQGQRVWVIKRKPILCHEDGPVCLPVCCRSERIAVSV
eukprot:g10559.t1